MSVSSSIIALDFMVPVMMWVSWFCTLLAQSKLDLVVVPHVVMPYLNTGLISSEYSLLRVTVSAPHVVPANFSHEGKSHLGSGFCFLGLLLPCQSLLEAFLRRCPQQSLTVDMQVVPLLKG